jgi:hypothetical protein
MAPPAAPADAAATLRALRRVAPPTQRALLLRAAQLWRPHREAKLRADPLGGLLDLVSQPAADGSLVVNHAALRTQLDTLSPAQRGELLERARAAPQRRCARCQGLCCGRRQQADVRSISSAATPAVTDVVG